MGNMGYMRATLNTYSLARGAAFAAVVAGLAACRGLAGGTIRLSLRERIEVRAFERFVPHHPPARRDVSR
jgi:hypothetical protein